MIVRHALVTTLLATLGALAQGCGSSGATWTTWYSGMCDARLDMPGAPASGFEVRPHTLGVQSLAIVREDAPVSRFVYSCRTFPQGHVQLKGPDAVAEDVLRHELTAFDASWIADTIQDKGAGSKGVTLTKASGERADIRVVAVPALSQTHATLTIGVAVELARRFVEAIEVVPRPKPGPMRVRSAECLSSIVMPGTPSGEFVDDVITHVHRDPANGRFYVLRCVFMNEMMQKRTPAELFQESLDDTLEGGHWIAAERVDLEIDGRYAREQRYVSADGARILTVRIAVDGSRLQIASYTGKTGEGAIATEYLGTFRIHGKR